MTDDNYNSYEEPKVCNHYNYKLEGDKWCLREDSFRDKNLITTPGWIVKDMLDLLPDSVWNTETTFLIPCIKSGNFAIEVKNRLMKCKDAMERFPSDEERRDHIDSKQLFCIYWYTEEEFDKNLISGHIWGVNGFLEALYSQSVNLMCTDDLNFDTFKDKTGKKQEKLLESIKEKFGTVKFDVVIGNPPYNNDLYIDFVEWGHQRANKYSLWITPAKWQAKGGDKNERFRKDIVPYMKDIVYYPNVLDVFPNTPMCGDSIAYYMIDKTIHNDKYINGELEEHWQTRYGLDNTCINIVKKISGNTIVESSDTSITPVKSYFTSRNFGDVSEDTSSRYYMRSSARCIRVPENVFKHTDDMDKYKVYIGHFITNNPVLHLVEPFVADVREDCLLGFGSKEKCESIISYYKCKLIWFLVCMTNCGNASKEAFVNVPDPGKFDHIFTDQELYKKYNLTDEEIHIIESVIKERK